MNRRSIWAMIGLFCAPVLGAQIYLATTSPERTATVAENSNNPTAPDTMSIKAGIVLPLPPPTSPTLDVDTFGPASVYPLAAWTVGSAGGGWFDSLAVGGAVAGPGTTVEVKDGDVIRVGGWAGDPSLGMRLPYVLLSICDVVVATVPVTAPRPDVAQTVHPHLGASGWQAKLLVDDLPRCETERLQAYGVAATRRVAFPLSGAFDLKISDTGSPTASAVNHARPAVLPDDIPEAAPLATLTIAGNRVNLRRCGDVACAAIGTLAAGTHDVTILDRTDDWLLLFSPKATGWLARRVVGSIVIKTADR